MNAAASSWCTRTKRIRSWCRRSASNSPLMPSPGKPKIVSTPQSASLSTRDSEAIFFMTPPRDQGGVRPTLPIGGRCVVGESPCERRTCPQPGCGQPAPSARGLSGCGPRPQYRLGLSGLGDEFAVTVAELGLHHDEHAPAVQRRGERAHRALADGAEQVRRGVHGGGARCAVRKVEEGADGTGG